MTQFVTVQDDVQFGLSHKHNLDELLLRRLQIGQHSNPFERVDRHTLRFIDDQHDRTIVTLFRQREFMVYLLITTPSGAAEFRLTSPVVKEQGTVANEQVFNSFGCSGKNISPELHWDNGPSETKSFALTVYDPDAPTGSGWWHWVVFNIPVSVHMLPANAGKPDNVIAEGAIQSMYTRT